MTSADDLDRPAVKALMAEALKRADPPLDPKAKRRVVIKQSRRLRLRARQPRSDILSESLFKRGPESPQRGYSMPVVMDAERISRALTRIAHEILEHNRGLSDLALVGVRSRGVPIAQRIADDLARSPAKTSRSARSTSRSIATT